MRTRNLGFWMRDVASTTATAAKKGVSFKMNSRFFNLCRVYSNLLKMASVGKFPWS